MHDWQEKLLQGIRKIKDKWIMRIKALLLKLSGEDGEKAEQLKIWLIGAAAFVVIIGLIWGITVISDRVNQVPPHVHNWEDATCVQAKFCAECGATDGEPLGHAYTSELTVATCTQQGYMTHTCSRCGDQYQSDFVEPGHIWMDADCENAKKCLFCSGTDGEPLGHTWVDATCNETKICSTCKKTEGEPLGHTYEDGSCVRCSKRKPSEGLEFDLLGDDTYRVSGIGTCTDAHIIIPDTYNGLPVVRIGTDAFYHVVDLISVTIPDSVTSIGHGAFAYCYNLTSVTIPASVKSMEANIFPACNRLTSIVFEGSVEQWHSITYGPWWRGESHVTEVICSDGTVKLD